MPTMKTLTVDGKTYTIEDGGAQRTLVSGINIKTINNESLLGSGNITVGATAMTDTEVIAAVNGAFSSGSGGGK